MACLVHDFSGPEIDYPKDGLTYKTKRCFACAQPQYVPSYNLAEADEMEALIPRLAFWLENVTGVPMEHGYVSEHLTTPNQVYWEAEDGPTAWVKLNVVGLKALVEALEKEWG